MTDKQIIINSVDVSGCECIIEDYQRANNFEGKYEHIKNVCELGERGAEYYNLFCKDNPNCYYKQLTHKGQECEELNERTASIIYSLTGGRLSYSTYTLEGCEQAYHDQLEIDVERATKELQEELQAKEQECENLKEDRERWKSNFNGKVSAIEELLQQLDQFKAKEQEVKRYKQALDEIEDVADDYNRVEKTSQYYRDGFDEIQDIINKAKEG